MAGLGVDDRWLNQAFFFGSYRLKRAIACEEIQVVEAFYRGKDIRSIV